MKLGFVSAILGDLSLEEVLEFAAAESFACVELACWPRGKADRRYAGVTHIDADEFTQSDANRINDLLAASVVEISSLCYAANPLSPDAEEAQVAIDHMRKVAVAAELLGVDVVTHFIGRDWTRSVDDNWPRFLEVWKPHVRFTEDHGVKVAIENCPMFFSKDEWPGGKNLAYSPAVWRRMFADIPNESFGLNLDPSHLIWQRIDYLKPLREFADRIFHTHAKDARVDQDKLDDVGILATPLEYHTPKLPGLGDVDWGRFFAVLSETGFDGAVSVEVEDRAYEGSLASRKGALRQSARFLRQFLREDL